MLPQLAAVRVDAVVVEDGLLRITARTRDDAGAVCPGCGRVSGWVHSRYVRHVADQAVGGCPVVVDLSVRRMYCEEPSCPRRTFAEQVPGLTERYQRRTPALRRVVEAVAVALAGSAGARLLAVLGCVLSWATVLDCLLRIPLPKPQVPRVVGIDEFALRKGHRYATVVVDAATGRRVDVLPDRATATVVAWLREHPQVQVVCRDGAGGFARAITDADPGIVQVADRWHLWHNLCEAVLKEVAVHSSCWSKLGPPLREGKRAATTRERWHQVHDLLDQGVGLLECARRLHLRLNTVNRYARHTEPERMVRAPAFRPTLVDPYRDHLRRRRAEDPAVTMPQLLAEIREQGYPGSANLLMRYITEGCVEADHATLSPRRAARLLLTCPDHLHEDQLVLRDQLTSACPQMTAPATVVQDFAVLLTPAPGNGHLLENWIRRGLQDGLPVLRSFARGLQRDQAAVEAAVTLPWHNGRTEGVNHKTKLIKRQTYGRAGFTLLRHRILLN
ncbi:ISL3 family transposase [Streptacidiphilus sp. N8-3]|uniref:ISL3 family transposase n=1 Tax=Streptacidiphilus cavernicola TaxID=3342716 RepID=A0ABV6VVG8_9ACTN